MSAAEEAWLVLASKFQAAFPHLDERQWQLLPGAEARSLGHGGIRLVARAAGVREATVSEDADELDAGAEPLGLVPALLALVEPDERGDPGMSRRQRAMETPWVMAGETAWAASPMTIMGPRRQEGRAGVSRAKVIPIGPWVAGMIPAAGVASSSKAAARRSRRHPCGAARSSAAGSGPGTRQNRHWRPSGAAMQPR
jgi:hypothetical protein